MTTMVKHRRLYRGVDGQLLGGVAVGLADHLKLPIRTVRLTFAVLCFAGGAGILLYGAFWIFVPQLDSWSEEESSTARDQSWLQGVTIAALTLIGYFTLTSRGVLPGGSATLPLIAALAGAALVWRQADETQRRRWRAATDGGRSGIIRNAAGGLLVGAGLIGFLAAHGQISAAKKGIVSTVVVVAGVAILTAPWWLKLSSDLTRERRERIRSEERAEVAAHIHDSVLQTLTLIQKSATKPTEVRRLARSQERELRNWLYLPKAQGSIIATLEQQATEVEEDFGVAVEVVSVGDCPQDAHLVALCAAAREAMVNAAKHSGANEVSVFAEVDSTRVVIFIRDRGSGFDVDTIPPDRFGVVESIRARMERNGGSAAIKSIEGEGTEIELTVIRA